MAGPAPLDDLPLDQQIAAAERRVIARDAAVREQLHALGAALREQAASGVRRGAFGLVTAAGFVAVAALARRATQAPRHRAPPSHDATRALPALPWPALVAVLWPLMPAALTARLNARTAGMVAGLASSLALPWWQRRRARRATRGHGR